VDKILCQNNNLGGVIHNKDISKASFKRIIKIYSNLSDEEINEIATYLSGSESVDAPVRGSSVETL